MNLLLDFSSIATKHYHMPQVLPNHQAFYIVIVEVTCYAWIYTSDVRGAGTDANVYLVVYGNKGKSDEVWLDNESNNFETGQTDNFKIEITDVGRPYKIRIGHDNKNPASAWHLNKVCLVFWFVSRSYIFRQHTKYLGRKLNSIQLCFIIFL